MSSIERPPLGWLRTVREGLGLSLRVVAERLGKLSPQAVHDFEKNEAVGTLTLRNLERTASAMGCRVVYLLLPQNQTQSFSDLKAWQSGDRRLVEDTEHTMKLEAQDVGGVAERAKRGLPRRGKK